MSRSAGVAGATVILAAVGAVALLSYRVRMWWLAACAGAGVALLHPLPSATTARTATPLRDQWFSFMGTPPSTATGRCNPRSSSHLVLTSVVLGSWLVS